MWWDDARAGLEREKAASRRRTRLDSAALGPDSAASFFPANISAMRRFRERVGGPLLASGTLMTLLGVESMVEGRRYRCTGEGLRTEREEPGLQRRSD